MILGLQVVELCRDLLRSLPRDTAKQVSIIAADVDTALEASNSLDNSIFTLDDDIDAKQLAPILLLAAPKLDQVCAREPSAPLWPSCILLCIGRMSADEHACTPLGFKGTWCCTCTCSLLGMVEGKVHGPAELPVAIDWLALELELVAGQAWQAETWCPVVADP